MQVSENEKKIEKKNLKKAFYFYMGKDKTFFGIK